MGCIARLGCLVVLAILGVVGWWTRDLWLPERFRSVAATAPASGSWQPVSEAGAERARAALARLSQSSGPVYETMSAGDLASLALSQAGRGMTKRADSVAARIDGDRLTMRARVDLADLKGRIGAVAGVLNDRETVELSGTMFIVRPGVGAFSVTRATLGRVVLPQGMIPRLVSAIDGGRRPAGLPDNAFLLPVPGHVGDIRIANGKVTVYKNVK